MIRFEDVQMIMAEALKEHFEMFSVQIFTEQFTLDRECKFFVNFPSRHHQAPLTASLSFVFDVFQTGLGLFADEIQQDNDLPYDMIDRQIDLDITISLPILKGDIDVLAVINEVEVEFPDVEPELILTKTLNSPNPLQEYEVYLYYELSPDDFQQEEYISEIIEELRDIMELIYERIKKHIDYSWYKE